MTLITLMMMIKIMLQHIFIILSLLFFVLTFWIFISINAKQFKWTHFFIPNENENVVLSFFFYYVSLTKKGARMQRLSTRVQKRTKKMINNWCAVLPFKLPFFSFTFSLCYVRNFLLIGVSDSFCVFCLMLLLSCVQYFSDEIHHY